LEQEWETYLHLQEQLKKVDAQIKKVLCEEIKKDDNKKQYIAKKKPHKRTNKNGFKNMDMNSIAYKYFEGVDLMEIEGVNDDLVTAPISEFSACRQFTSWLRLAPNNKISSGKMLNRHIPKGSSFWYMPV